MTDVPKSIAENRLTIMGVDLVVHVLDNGQRIIEGDGMERLFAAMADGVEITPDDAMKMAKVVRS